MNSPGSGLPKGAAKAWDLVRITEILFFPGLVPVLGNASCISSNNRQEHNASWRGSNWSRSWSQAPSLLSRAWPWSPGDHSFRGNDGQNGAFRPCGEFLEPAGQPVLDTSALTASLRGEMLGLHTHCRPRRWVQPG